MNWLQRDQNGAVKSVAEWCEMLPMSQYGESKRKEMIMQNKGYPKLLSCPFCGGTEIEFGTNDKYRKILVYNPVETGFVRCCTCGARTKTSITMNLAVYDWNRRPNHD